MRNESQVTPTQAKRLLRKFLTDAGAYDIKLKARTIDFTDLARATCVFVTVEKMTVDGERDHKWRIFREAKGYARKNGFRIYN